MNLQTKKNNFYIDLLIGVTIFVLPFFVHLHLLASPEKDVIEIFFWSYNHSFYSNEVYFWYFITWTIPLFLMGLWYMTTFYRWRLFILFPFSSYLTDILATHIQVDYGTWYVVLFILTWFLSLALLESINRQYTRKQGVSIFKWDLNSLADYNFPKRFYQDLQDILPSTDMEEIIYLKNLLHTNKIIKNSRFNLFGPSVIPDLPRNFKIFIVITLISTALLYHMFLLFPSDADSFAVGFIHFKSYGFGDLMTFMYTLLPKTTLLICLILWFILNKYWWKYAILCPITITIVQIMELHSTEQYIDTYNTLQHLPLILVLLAFLVFVSTQIQYRYRLMDIFNVVEKEIEKIISKRSQHSSVILKETLERLKKSDNESELDAGLRLQRLLALKEEIQKQINKKD